MFLKSLLRLCKLRCMVIRYMAVREGRMESNNKGCLALLQRALKRWLVSGQGVCPAPWDSLDQTGLTAFEQSLGGRREGKLSYWISNGEVASPRIQVWLLICIAYLYTFGGSWGNRFPFCVWAKSGSGEKHQNLRVWVLSACCPTETRGRSWPS